MREPRRATSALFLTAACLASCTRLLGIDGTYIAVISVDGGGGGIQGAGGVRGTGGASGDEDGSSATRGVDGAGGAGPGAGGSSTGGSVASGGRPDGTGGATPPPTGGAGGASPPIDAGPPDCQPGTYTGTFKGRHAPAAAFVPVAFDVSGTFSVTLAGTGRVLQVTTVTGFQSQFAWGKWVLDRFTGAYDCDADTLAVTVNGHLDALPAIANTQGTLSGPVKAGVWQEAETPGTGIATACKGGGIVPVGTGCGSWTLMTHP